LNPHEPYGYVWVRDYADVTPCIELLAQYSDDLKKDKTFIPYAVMLAKQIAIHHRLKCKVTLGKWGARLETGENPNLTESELERYAQIITNDRCWKHLAKSTWVFTHGRGDE